MSLSRLCLLAGFFLSPLAAAIPAAPVPISAFVEEDKFAHPRMSPDGKHLAVTARMRDREDMFSTVAIYTLPALQMVSITRMPAFEKPLDYTWVSNTRLLVTKARELGSEEAPRATGEVMAMNIDGSKQEYLYGYKMGNRRNARYDNDYGYGEITGVPTALNGHFLLQAHEWRSDHSYLYDIDSMNGVRKTVVRMPHPAVHFVVQQDGAPRFAIGTDEQNLPKLYEKAGDGWRLVEGSSLGVEFWPVAFAADGASYYALHSPEGGPLMLSRQDVATGARTTLLKDPFADVAYVQKGPRNQGPFAAATVSGVPRWTYFDEQSAHAQLHKTLSAAFPSGIVDFLGVSDDGQRVLFAVESDRDPGSYYLYDRATNNAALLMTRLEQLDPERMALRKPIRYTARDGLELDGYLTLPAPGAAAPGVKPPLVLMPHGGPHGIRDVWFFDRHAQFLASRGYAVLEINYRGSGGRGPAFLQAGWRQWGGEIQDDLADGVRWAVAQGHVDGGRACVFGASFGAYSALMLAAREPGMFRCAVGYAGIYDLALLYEEPEAKHSKRYFNYLVDAIGQDQAELAKFSPSTQAGAIRVPVLLVHGEEDEVAPIEHAHVMRDALAAAGRAPEWMQVPGEGHGFYNPAKLGAFYEKLEQFLGRHIGPARAP